MLTFLAGDVFGSSFENLTGEEFETALNAFEHAGQTYTDETIVALSTIFWLMTPDAVAERKPLSKWLIPMLNNHREHFLDSGLLAWLEFPASFQKNIFRANVICGIIAPIAFWAKTDQEAKETLALALSDISEHIETRNSAMVLLDMIRTSFSPDMHRNPQHFISTLAARHPLLKEKMEGFDWNQEKENHVFSNQLPELLGLVGKSLVQTPAHEIESIREHFMKVLQLQGNASSQLALSGLLHEGVFGLNEQFAFNMIIRKEFFFDHLFPNLIYAFMNSGRVRYFFEKNQRTLPELKSWFTSVPTS